MADSLDQLQEIALHRHHALQPLEPTKHLVKHYPPQDGEGLLNHPGNGAASGLRHNVRELHARHKR